MFKKKTSNILILFGIVMYSLIFLYHYVQIRVYENKEIINYLERVFDIYEKHGSQVLKSIPNIEIIDKECAEYGEIVQTNNSFCLSLDGFSVQMKRKRISKIVINSSFFEFIFIYSVLLGIFFLFRKFSFEEYAYNTIKDLANGKKSEEVKDFIEKINLINGFSKQIIEAINDETTEEGIIQLSLNFLKQNFKDIESIMVIDLNSGKTIYSKGKSEYIETDIKLANLYAFNNRNSNQINFSQDSKALIIDLDDKKLLFTIVFKKKAKEFYDYAIEIIKNDMELALKHVRKFLDYRSRAIKDSLTGVYSRYYFFMRLDEEVISAKRYGEKFAFSIIDINNLKKVNDKYGHDKGDELIKTVTNILKEGTRKSDVVGRLGGDEFGIIWKKITKDSVKKLERRLINISKDKTLKDIDVEVSFSIGTAVFDDDGNTSKELFEIADKRMYEMKKKLKVGRDYDK